MKILPSIPPQMMGRGHPKCVPIECDCGCLFLWEHSRGADVTCPDCKHTQKFVDGEGAVDVAFIPHNGQHR